MTHILLISYSGGTQKCRTMGGLVREHEYEVTILTTRVPPELKAELPDAVTVIEIPDPRQISVYRPAWVLSAQKIARQLLADAEIEVVLSWQVPIASHILAAIATRGHDIPWVAHFGDPWIGNPYATGKLRKLLYSKRLEHYIVTTADRVTMPTERMKKMYADRHNLPDQQLRVVPNNIDPAEIHRVEPHDFETDGLQLVHIGSFYGPRTPEPLFEAINRLPHEVRSNLTVTLVGNLNEYEDSIAAHGVDDVVNAIGRRPKNAALAYAKGSDVLVLIDAPIENSPFLPTKLAEYVFMNRPILGITPDPGTSAEVIRETNTGIVTPPSKPRSIAEAITTYYQQALNNTLSVSPDTSARKRYTSRAAVAELAVVLDQVR